LLEGNEEALGRENLRGEEKTRQAMNI